MDAIAKMLSGGAALVWGLPLIVLLFGAHLFLTFRLRFIQRYILTAIKLSFNRTREGEGEISHFGALTAALAATIGTGNIVGVATAVALGGPGAVLWMWLTGVFGFATKYSEAVLSLKYRVVRPDGSVAGGPMYVLERGLGRRWLGRTFALFTAIAALGIGNGVQANAISRLMAESAGIDPRVSGLLLMIFSAAVILGGIRSIAKFCEYLVPFMAGFYIISCSILLVLKYETLPETILLILQTAFTGHAAVGGFVGAGIGQAIRMGVARGLFSNEAGMGSAPIVAAAAQSKNPVRQALISATGTFWDTVVVCALTGLVIVNAGHWRAGGTGVALTHQAFEVLPVFGPVMLTVSLFTFVFSTILGWSYYGEKAVEYLVGGWAVKPYRCLWVVVVYIGAVANLQAVWDFADIANALMAVPNLISLFALNGVIVAETKRYLWDGSLDAAQESPAS